MRFSCAIEVEKSANGGEIYTFTVSVMYSLRVHFHSARLLRGNFMSVSLSFQFQKTQKLKMWTQLWGKIQSRIFDIMLHTFYFIFDWRPIFNFWDWKNTSIFMAIMYMKFQLNKM